MIYGSIWNILTMSITQRTQTHTHIHTQKKFCWHWALAQYSSTCVRIFTLNIIRALGRRYIYFLPPYPTTHIRICLFIYHHYHHQHHRAYEMLFPFLLSPLPLTLLLFNLFSNLQDWKYAFSILMANLNVKFVDGRRARF